MGTRDFRRLADAVQRRRIQLGYTPRKRWPTSMRLSEGVIRKIESGRASNFRQETLIALELDLGWAPGSVKSILAGGEPTIEKEAS